MEKAIIQEPKLPYKILHNIQKNGQKKLLRLYKKCGMEYDKIIKIVAYIWRYRWKREDEPTAER